MGIDQRDDQAEGLWEICARKPALDLAGVDLVPALPLAGVAAPEVLRLRVLSRVGRLPVGESVFRLDPPLVGLAPAAQQAPLALGGVGEMPLALVRDVIAGGAKQGRQIGHVGRELGLVSPALAYPQQALAELGEHSPGRRLAAPDDVQHRCRHRRCEAWIGPEVGRRQGELDPMLGREQSREQRGAARRAHRRVAEGVAKGEAGVRQLGVVRHQLAQPAGILGPVTRCSLLVRDQDQDVGRLHETATASPGRNGRRTSPGAASASSGAP